jgi:PAS domain S-box-containing protein
MGQTSRPITPDIQLFRDVFNASSIGIAVENLEGQPLFVNPAFCAFLGFSEEELHSKHCVDFSPPEDAEKDWALFQQLRAGSIDHYHLEKRYFRRDGSLVWGRLSLSLLNHRPSPLVLAMVEEITEQKKAEEAQSRLAAIVESSDDAIASGTLDGIIVSWNAGAQRIYGYTEAEAVGKPISILVPLEQPDEENKILETLNAGGRIEQFETVRVTKTGKRINVSLSISPIKDSSGRTVGVSGIARDITERKLAEQTLHDSEERLRLAQKVARIGSFEWNIQTGVNIWTPELETIYGLAPGGFGKTQFAFENLVHPDDRARVIELAQSGLKSGQPAEGEWRVLWGDGSVHWVAGRWQALMNESGEAVRIIGVNIDVTQRKQAELAAFELTHALEDRTVLLQSREELLKTFVKNVPAGVAMFDRDMRYLQVSDRWCADYSVESSQILGRSQYDILPDMPEGWREVHRRVLEGETLRADEERWDRKDGTTLWVRWEVRPWRTSNGIIGGLLILAEDITPRKQMQDALSTMSRKLIEAQEQERARIGRELHDDINQRLAMLAVELEQLQDNPAEVGSRLRELRTQTTEISNDVQALSHELHSSKLEYLGVVGGIKSWCREFGERQRMEVEFKSDVVSVLPLDVGVCLFRVLQEAMHNAIKYSGTKRVEVQLAEHSNEVHLIVRDSGRGFDVEAAGQGRGLGLTSMQERVRLMSGTISIESKPMGGTTIHVRVPFSSASDSMRAAG